MRLARVEIAVRDSAQLHQRIEALEEKAARIKLLEAQLEQAQANFRVISDVTAKIDLTAKQLELLRDPLLQRVFATQGIKVFRTDTAPHSIEDVTIDGSELYKKSNWGRQSYISLGTGNRHNTRRSLMKFNSLTPHMMKGKKILAAVLYMMQVNSENLMESAGALNETVNVYAVRKGWTQGKSIDGDALPGYVSWISARAGQEDWASAGCSKENADFDPALLATSGPAVTFGAGQWVPVIFTPEGIGELQSLLEKDTAVNNGFLLKVKDESKGNAMLSFNASEWKDEKLRPYLEIYYVDDPVGDAAVEK